MAVNRIEAEIGPASDEPLPERWVRLVKNTLWRYMPVNTLRLLGPEPFRVIDGAMVEVEITIIFRRPTGAGQHTRVAHALLPFMWVKRAIPLDQLEVLRIGN
ncbi:hypothetical protein D3C78_1464790 [compost metagenome]